MMTEIRCKQSGTDFTLNGGRGRPRVYCSAACRLDWYAAHRPPRAQSWRYQRRTEMENQ
jgi:hypothetical protein